MNKKLSITLLSLFFVCTSNAMENMAMVSSAGSDAVQEDEPVEQPRMTRYVSSLKDFAIAQVQRNVHRALKEDVDLLQKDGQLTPENVEKNLINQIALLSVPDELKEKVLQAYRDSPRWSSVSSTSTLLDHKDPRHVELWMQGKDDSTERIIFCNANSNASQVAVLAQGYSILRETFAQHRSLYLWREIDEGWIKKLQPAVSESAEDVVWPSDNSLLVASENDITIFTRKKDGDDFVALHVVPIARYSDPDFDIHSMTSGRVKMGALWKSFGRFSWSDKEKLLAVETKRNSQRSELTIASLKDDGSIEKIQTLDIPISSEWGINSIEWDEDGTMHLSCASPEEDHCLRIFVYAPTDKNGTYGLQTKYVFSSGAVAVGLWRKNCTAHSEDDRWYVFSQAQKDSIRSMAPMVGVLKCEEHGWEPRYDPHMPIAIREHSEEKFRVIAYRNSGTFGYDRYGFKVYGMEPALHALCNSLCRDNENKKRDIYFWRRLPKQEDI